MPETDKREMNCGNFIALPHRAICSLDEGASPKLQAVARSALYSERLVELGGEFRDGLGNFRRLVGDGGHHTFGEMRFVLENIQAGDHEGEVIVNVVTKIRELLIQLGNLLDRQSYGLPG